MGKLGGGGTDLPAYSSKYGGFVVTSALNKYIYVLVKDRFEKALRVSYSVTEIEEDFEKIKHPVVREALRLLGLKEHLEIVSSANMPSETGLGSSGSFTVGLLNALHAFKDEHLTRLLLAEESTDLTMDILKEPCGCQDTYISAFGGFICLGISKEGKVVASPLKIKSDIIQELENNLLFFYTEIKRSANLVLVKQCNMIKLNPEPMHDIKFFGWQVKRALEEGNLSEFGRLQDMHWCAKKSSSEGLTTPEIDRFYKIGLNCGAKGGKLVGAGGGGFLMFYCNDGKDKLRKAMAKERLQEVRFRFEPNGTKVMVNL